MDMARLIATFGGCGLSPRAPGTVGSLAALVVGLPLLKRPRLLVAGIAVVTVVGWWATKRSGKGEDHSWIVIDEVAGMWIALLACLPKTEEQAREKWFWMYPLLSFAFFRLFDITKPGPVGALDKRHDATGVMGDDVVAGAMAALCVKGVRTVVGRSSH